MKSNFQTILTAIFIAIFVFAVLVFSGLLDIGRTKKNTSVLKGDLVVWGTLEDKSMANTMLEVDPSKESELGITYVKKNKATYQSDLIEAFAEGTGPDIFIITPDMIVRNDKFVQRTPYENYPEKTFRDTYIDGADIFLDKDGVYAFPLIVDPMVLYYNKNILANEGIAKPPVYWDELFALNSKLTKKATSGNIDRSMIALGGYENINNAKAIISTLLLQSNNKIVGREESSYEVLLDARNTGGLDPEKPMEFYMSFSDSTNSAYSWNKSLPNSLDMFTAGKLAFYIGFASELFNIQSMNPNLSYDITRIPQLRDIEDKRNFGEIYALAINKRSKNIGTAMSVASMMGTSDVVKSLSTNFSLPPASRSYLSSKPKETYLYSFWDSAIISKSWLDPDHIKSENIFKDMVNNIIIKKDTVGGALRTASEQLTLLLK